MISFHIDWALLLGPIIGVVLPLLVAIVTKVSTPSHVKAILLAVLAVITNLLTGIDNAVVHHTEYDLGAALILALTTFVISVAVHFGFFVPIGVTEDLQTKVGPKDGVTAPRSRHHTL